MNAPVASEDRAAPLEATSGAPVAAAGHAGRLAHEQKASYFEQLDEALKSLDAKLRDRSTPASEPPSKVATPSDQNHGTIATARAPTPPVEPEPASIAAGEEKPVFEIDDAWFEPRDRTPVSPPTRPRSPDPAGASALRAERQRQGAPPPPLQTTYELSDEAIERIAARVADRLTRGSPGEDVNRLTTEMLQRFVREEIARQGEAPGVKNNVKNE